MEGFNNSRTHKKRHEKCKKTFKLYTKVNTYDKEYPVHISLTHKIMLEWENLLPAHDPPRNQAEDNRQML